MIRQTHLYEYKLIPPLCGSVLGVFLQSFNHCPLLLTILAATALKPHTQNLNLQLSVFYKKKKKTFQSFKKNTLKVV